MSRAHDDYSTQESEFETDKIGTSQSMKENPILQKSTRKDNINTNMEKH